MEPLPVIPGSQDHAQCIFRSLYLLPALQYEAGLSNSILVRCHASLMIANQRQIEDSSSKRCITLTATAVTNIEPYADTIKTATVGTDNAADDYPTETATTDTESATDEDSIERGAVATEIAIVEVPIESAATANEMALGLLNWYTRLQARAVDEVPIECFAAEAAKSKWCVHQ